MNLFEIMIKPIRVLLIYVIGLEVDMYSYISQRSGIIKEPTSISYSELLSFSTTSYPAF